MDLKQEISNGYQDIKCTPTDIHNKAHCDALNRFLPLQTLKPNHN